MTCKRLSLPYAVGVWGWQWRFLFGIGPHKTAVPVVDSRTTNFAFHLSGNVVPCMRHYCYVGVVFQASRKWRKHAQRRIERSTVNFISWAENRGLCTNFRSNLFRTYMLPPLLYCCFAFVCIFLTFFCIRHKVPS